MKQYTRVRYGAAVILFTLFISAFAIGQADTGTPAFGSFTSGPDVTNLGNLNVHFSFPVVSKPGRGIPFSYALGYDSSVWSPSVVNGVNSWQPAANWGWEGQTQVKTGYVLYRTNQHKCYTDTSYWWNTYIDFSLYVDQNGVSHPLNQELVFDLCDDSNTVSAATVPINDGSGLTIDLQITGVSTASAVVHTRSGTALTPPVVKTPAPGIAIRSEWKSN